MAEKRRMEMVLEYQNYIESPPVRPAQMYGAACSSDTITIDTWLKTWISNVQANHKHFGSFKKYSLGNLYQTNQFKPAFIVGSGPSLGFNGHLLKERNGMMAISCLHNYHFFEDREIEIDYYVTLDAGPVVLEEISEGGKKTPDEYWASTKNKKLCAFIGSDPHLFDKWQGEVFLFNAPIPSPQYTQSLNDLEPFYCFVSNGGNVLGACLYIAKAFMGSNPIAFVGADFCFAPNQGKGHKFHAWDSKYDAKLGNVMRGFDVFGNKAITWQSYFNFKNFFDFVCLQVPGIWFNCTEGGILGSYPEGNLMAIRQVALGDFLEMYKMNEILKGQMEAPELPDNKLLF